MHKKVKNGPTKTGDDGLCRRNEEALCPVTAVMAWLARRGKAPGPLFHYASGQPLSQSLFIVDLKKAFHKSEKLFWIQYQSWSSDGGSTSRYWRCDNQASWAMAKHSLSGVYKTSVHKISQFVQDPDKQAGGKRWNYSVLLTGCQRVSSLA